MDEQEMIDRGLTTAQVTPVEGGAPGNFVPDMNAADTSVSPLGETEVDATS